jgi:hypothetical protein
MTDQTTHAGGLLVDSASSVELQGTASVDVPMPLLTADQSDGAAR